MERTTTTDSFLVELHSVIMSFSCMWDTNCELFRFRVFTVDVQSAQIPMVLAPPHFVNACTAMDAS